jgi:hypothetical protein
MNIKSVSGKDIPVRVGMLVWLGNQTGRVVALGNETARVQVGIVVHKGVTSDHMLGCR